MFFVRTIIHMFDKLLSDKIMLIFTFQHLTLDIILLNLNIVNITFYMVIFFLNNYFVFVDYMILILFLLTI